MVDGVSHLILVARDDHRRIATGLPVEGYEMRLVDDDDNLVADGELGNLEVAGPTSAVMYWNQREKSRETFKGKWTKTGDKYTIDENGYYIYGGRSDDMLKVGGIYVSPFEVEGALVEHEAVLEAAVVGHPDEDKLIKPKAFVVPAAAKVGPGVPNSRTASVAAGSAPESSSRNAPLPAAKTPFATVVPPLPQAPPTEIAEPLT